MPETPPNAFESLLTELTDASVDFIIVGGVAGAIHGAIRLTQDLDIVYRRTPENIERLVAALARHKPYLRGAPRGLPFQWSAGTISAGLNFTLTTELGLIDLLGEITGGGTFDDLVAHSIFIDAFGLRCRCLDLEHLIHTKRAAGRPKDLEAIAELEALLEETTDE